MNANSLRCGSFTFNTMPARPHTVSASATISAPTGAVVVVGDARVGSRAALDDDGDAVVRHLVHTVGRDRDPVLVGLDLARNADDDGVAAVTRCTAFWLAGCGEHAAQDRLDLVELGVAGDERRRQLHDEVAAVVGAADQAGGERLGSDEPRRRACPSSLPKRSLVCWSFTSSMAQK